jgi:hypothetical protein
MRTATGAAMLMAFSLFACGSDPDSPGSSESELGFNPPAAPEGYQRFKATTVPGIQPGKDVTYCQYVMAPTDRDLDVLDVGGYQSKWGHHAVVFSYTGDGTQQVGASTPCMGSEFNVGGGAGGTNLRSLQGTFLGGIGGEGGTGRQLPEGVAFRLKAGQGVMLNIHYINTGQTPMDGDAVVDIKFAEVDPKRTIAAMFINLNAGFNLEPRLKTDSSIDCVAQADVKFLMMANHMHEYGIHAKTEVVRAGTGAVELLKEDPQWTYEMQFNVEYNRWPLENPFVLRAGDTIRTTCSWTNSTDEKLGFPREMCLGVGFALATGDKPTAPACFQGRWVPSFGG